MIRAKAMGIDAFALNIGTDSYTDRQLGFAYDSAAKNGMQVFISFDFAWWNAAGSATAVGQKIAAYASKPAQLKIAGKVFASSFLGDALDVAAMRRAAGVDVYWAPNYFPGQSDVSKIDGALSWMVSCRPHSLSLWVETSTLTTSRRGPTTAQTARQLPVPTFPSNTMMRCTHHG